MGALRPELAPHLLQAPVCPSENEDDNETLEMALEKKGVWPREPWAIPGLLQVESAALGP